MTMYERIKYLRKQKGMSQEELALKCGYSNRSAIARIERGDRNLIASKIKVIADALGVTPSYLMDGEKNTSPDEQEVLQLFSALSEDDKKKIVDYALLLIKAAEHGE